MGSLEKSLEKTKTQKWGIPFGKGSTVFDFQLIRLKIEKLWTEHTHFFNQGRVMANRAGGQNLDTRHVNRKIHHLSTQGSGYLSGNRFSNPDLRLWGRSTDVRRHHHLGKLTERIIPRRFNFPGIDACCGYMSRMKGAQQGIFIDDTSPRGIQ